MKNRHYLLNRVFLLSLLTLLFNDWYLKAAYPSFLSGKLSDISGLIVFVFFFSFLLGNRFKTLVFISTAILFCWWKSSFSHGFIDKWNDFFPFYSIDRVVDYTDLICLLVLIPIYFYRPNKTLLPFSNQGILIPVLFLSVFAITATSKAKHINAYDTSVKYSIQKSFKLKMTHSEFLKNLSFSNIAFEKNPNTIPPKKSSDPHGYILKNFTIREGLTVESMLISVSERNKRIKLSIHEVSIIDPPAETGKEIKKRIVDETKELFALEN
ncbi:MAG: hypothetical protein K0S23_272 [Fluviicola sp.]|jgi:hypothetical protein|uniref:hypothetical protein n=1 Tax=Fluviicola sp. TaxID=1917219 RepID=UPI00261ACC25|nr:hypothetical protein [Fluviicola sp.]MDF3025965.1 hypothetical protein [Fluviicola sp.]